MARTDRASRDGYGTTVHGRQQHDYPNDIGPTEVFLQCIWRLSVGGEFAPRGDTRPTAGVCNRCRPGALTGRHKHRQHPDAPVSRTAAGQRHNRICKVLPYSEGTPGCALPAPRSPSQSRGRPCPSDRSAEHRCVGSSGLVAGRFNLRGRSRSCPGHSPAPDARVRTRRDFAHRCRGQCNRSRRPTRCRESASGHRGGFARAELGAREVHPERGYSADDRRVARQAHAHDLDPDRRRSRRVEGGRALAVGCWRDHAGDERRPRALERAARTRRRPQSGRACEEGGQAGQVARGAGRRRDLLGRSPADRDPAGLDRRPRLAQPRLRPHRHTARTRDSSGQSRRRGADRIQVPA